MALNKAMCARRKEKDIFKLKVANYTVNDCEQQSTYHIQFKGPTNTIYESGKWIINLFLPEEYPYKSPSVGFINKIYHPNIDFNCGSVCLDVINQTWTPMYQLVNIFEIFLPQLLTYPNPSSPLNHQAANLYIHDIQKYNYNVRQHIEKYASMQKLILPHQQQHKQQQHECKQESIYEEGSSLSDDVGLDGDLQLY